MLIGVSVNGAVRWLTIAGQQFQPSDIAKLTILLYIARQLSIQRESIKDLKLLYLDISKCNFLNDGHIIKDMDCVKVNSDSAWV